jgi:Cd2+/Zn2+-exporting ATPase
MSDTITACCDQKKSDCGCGHSQDGKHDHRHAQVSLWAAAFGAILIINGFLAKSIYDDEFVSTLSSVAGAFILALPILWSAFQDLIKGRIHMDVMVAIGLLAAIMKQQFQESGIIAFFMIIAIALEERTAHGAKKSIEDIISLTPSTARLLGDDGEETQVQATTLKVGDVVRVRPGENFPADGVVLKGRSTVNQASITGESLPVDKDETSDIYAGTENLTGAIDFRVTGVGEDTTLGKVRDLIQNAENSKLPILRIIDKYLVYYAPVVVMLALMVWFATGDLMRFVYVLVISCPCALVLATPSAVVAAIASAARLGLLIKDVSHIETAAGIKAVIFDKTGTLTEGRLEVAKLNPAEGVELADLLTNAVTAESQSNHPAAKAMRRLAREADIDWETPDSFEEIPGLGVIAKTDGATIRIGRASWLTEEGLDVSVLDTDSDDDASHGKSVVFVSRDDTVLGWIAMSDGIRKSAKDAIDELRELGVRSHMVTGDNESVATVVAEKLGIKRIKAECLPQDKVDYVESLREGGNHIAVVGDGINDAPALAAGDVSVAMGAIGSDVAINSASVALMNDDLRRIPFIIKLSRKTRTIINMNLAFGCLMIVGGIMLFIFGDNFLNGIAGRIFRSENPSILKSFIAAGLHTVGTLLVVFNSARLVRFGEDLDQGK